jgi:hypothetical protein
LPRLNWPWENFLQKRELQGGHAEAESMKTLATWIMWLAACVFLVAIDSLKWASESIFAVLITVPPLLLLALAWSRR